MTSRIGAIIQSAELRSATWIDGLSDGSRTKSGATAINGICAALVKRKTPICPTAKVVSEEGLKTDPKFPKPQTIYNAHRELLRIWSESYRHIMNVNVDAPLRPDQVSEIDTEHMDATTGNLVEHLKAIISELTNRCNVLKRIIDEAIPVGGALTQTGHETESTILGLKEWLARMPDSFFVLDELGLRTTRKTPIGAIIMDKDQYNRLARLADEALRTYRANESARL